MTTKAINDAKLAEVNEIGENSAEFVIRPLYYGYGNTLGNSLRRVLLSSIKGAAITSFSIEGATHEFTAVPGIREDVVDIMLNLKNIRFTCHTDSPVEATLEIKGSEQKSEKDGDKRVTAADIKLPADLELGNPNQVICHIDDPKFTLKMRFMIETGRGYLTIDESGKDRVYSDMIALDAVFTPVLRVRYKVENTRVGRDTNLQQLTLTVDTDGTITPKEAFEEAAAILVNQYQALAGGTTVESAPIPGYQAEENNSDLLRPIEELGLSARTANALTNNGIKNLSQLVNLTEAQLKDLKGFGAKALEEVQQIITESK
ncbi:DNA-directed RNA polymerase subunit alpha [Candidatus Saccharibacteria bacterium]|nr:DNA-directed RNA polymerase subunit alpha [Candidatus Saccharibacteria bacterium]